MVDLAGSERVLKTRSEGVVLKEAGYINKSLTFLEQVVIAISEGRQHIPYRFRLSIAPPHCCMRCVSTGTGCRSAKLTHLLKHALGGNSKTTLIANIWDDSEHRVETLSTLRFAQRMARIEITLSHTPALDHEAMIANYAQEVDMLKAELAEATGRRSAIPGTRVIVQAGEQTKHRVSLLDMLRSRASSC